MASEPRVGIVGLGAVGRGLARLFPGAAVHDPPLGRDDRPGINGSDVAFVCVPTPRGAGGACDTTLVEDAVRWIDAPCIVVRSTVPPGTTARLAQEHGKRVVFQPEYGPGETPGHPFADTRAVPWVILGGPREWTAPVSTLYQRVFNSNLEIRLTDSTTAELTKYMENAFLATKVAFCNEFYDLAGGLGVDYTELRELWLLDPRAGRSHTWVHPDDRGFGGSCLPKDLDALLDVAGTAGVSTELLDGVRASNRRLRGSRPD